MTQLFNDKCRDGSESSVMDVRVVSLLESREDGSGGIGFSLVFG